MKSIIYRNIAAFCGIVNILNIILFQHLDLFSKASIFINLIIVPLMLIFGALWIKNRIGLISLVLFLIGYTFEIFMQFYSPEKLDDYIFYAIFIIIGLLMMSIAVLLIQKRVGYFKSLKILNFTH
jgi:hypothetical protein|tara:strand:- start:5618 stop:5992 length:375 start_codon:yes stop_codon:yes gene_type:complete